MVEYVGTLNTQTLLDFHQNAIGVVNDTGGSSVLELRSISRDLSDIAAGSLYPNRAQVIGDGIPVPWVLTSQVWNTNIFYIPGNVVSYNGLPFLALKASQGVTPPVNGVATLEWQPIGYDGRIALMLSGFNQAAVGSSAVSVTPYVLWFDQSGALITALYIRSPNGTGAPASLFFDSFALSSNWGVALASTTADVGGAAGSALAWTANNGAFTVSGFNNGCVVPATSSSTNIATVNYGSANAFVGVTITTLSQSGYVTGLAVRFNSATSYIRVDQNQIVQVNGAGNPVMASHLTPFQAGDRMTVSCNGNSIIVYRNGTQVSQVSTSFNNSQTKFGITVDSTAGILPGQLQPLPTTTATRVKRKRRGKTRSNKPGEAT
jgi:hypothetical protein